MLGNHLLGLYEKALPPELTWEERLRAVTELGFDYLEISIDEKDERLARLDWTQTERCVLHRAMRETGVPIQSMCLSGHRRFPYGSADPAVRARAYEITEKAVLFAREFGIRVIQLAGYDVYYEPPTRDSRARYLEGMQRALEVADQYQVTLAREIMDTPFLNSISEYLALKERLPSPWLQVYPDLGNLTACGNDVEDELRRGIHDIVGIHVKETKPVGPNFPGAFRDVPFGEGSVDFVHCFKTLRDLDYSGPFLMEMWTEKAADPLVEIARARQWVGERLKQGGYA